ncbi:unnamed protein product [Prorocentrum cordatum]|uniref:Uncharacterized protein n=1 Tax=Prorocentrum cordatum TaxID=2364126 RepID=A0ABN9X002_9DINO|nr:unnamed protein product [Polarella glacialis]
MIAQPSTEKTFSLFYQLASARLAHRVVLRQFGLTLFDATFTPCYSFGATLEVVIRQPNTIFLFRHGAALRVLHYPSDNRRGPVHKMTHNTHCTDGNSFRVRGDPLRYLRHCFHELCTKHFTKQVIGLSEIEMPCLMRCLAVRCLVNFSGPQ